MFAADQVYMIEASWFRYCAVLQGGICNWLKVAGFGMDAVALLSLGLEVENRQREALTGLWSSQVSEPMS